MEGARQQLEILRGITGMFNELGVKDSSVTEEKEMEELVLGKGDSECDR